MRAFKFLLACVMCLAIAGACWMGWFALRPLTLASDPVDLTIKPGSSMRGAAQQISDAGIKLDPMQFALFARIMGKASAVKAGNYEVERGTTAFELLGMITRGDVKLVSVAFIEGWSFRQVRETLDQHGDIVHETKGLSEAEIAQRVGLTEKSLEGQFFPDTYLFNRSTTDVEVLRMAHRAMKRQLDAAWEGRTPGLPYRTPYEALTMASIVEKETGTAADRPKVAGVFINRLRTGMLLQTDPTVIYGLGDAFDGNLRKRDLTTDGPYNTYTRPGLPPTPICMPGLASLRAAMNPPAHDYLYFVARGDGSSEFSRNLDDHNRAVARYQKRH